MNREPHISDSITADGANPRRYSRRTFLRGAAVKAAYVTPVVLTLSANSAKAGSEFNSTCGDVGSPCTTGLECCSLICNNLTMTCN